MVALSLVPAVEDVVSIKSDGTEVVLPAASTEDSFVSSVRGMQLHKRKRNEEANSVKTKSEEEDTNPFRKLYGQLYMAEYELNQLTELTGFLCDPNRLGSAFRLESLQTKEVSSKTRTVDLKLALKLKQRALVEAVTILKTGRQMLLKAQVQQAKYLTFVQYIQSNWRLQAVAHSDTNMTSLKPQEPLAVDCSFYSAGSVAHSTKKDKARNAARLLNGDKLLVEVNDSTYRTLSISVEDAKTHECLATHFLKPLLNLDMELVDHQLEERQNNEFCNELFHLVSTEAVQKGDLSSGGTAGDGLVGSERSKVTVVVNCIDRIVISATRTRNIVLAIVPVCDAEERTQDYICHSFCTTAGLVAQKHLRKLHCRLGYSPLLATMVDMYRQIEVTQIISNILDSTSYSNIWLCLRYSWRYEKASSYVTIHVGDWVLINCQVVNGYISLTSISVTKNHEMPIEWEIAQQNGDLIFASPDFESKFKTFLKNVVRTELTFLLAAYLTPIVNSSIEWIDNSIQIENHTIVISLDEHFEIKLDQQVIKIFPSPRLAARSIVNMLN